MTRTTIAEDIKQGKPFSSLEQEVYLSLQRTADELQSRVSAVLKTFGVSTAQYNVLRILRGAGASGLRCSEIGERMITREPDITRLLDRMAKAGWITQSRDTSDRRVVMTRITPLALKLLKEMDKPVTEFSGTLMSNMGEKKLRTLVSLLDELRSGE
jgi:MarR family transcriptional regulator, organic hydroperoxide resistance regulator